MLHRPFLPSVEQMDEAIANGKYDIVIMADLEGAFECMERRSPAGINNNLLAVLSSFLTDRVRRNFLN